MIQSLGGAMRFTLFGFALLAGCASQAVQDFDQRANRVQPGMSIAEATAVMGAPKNRQFSGKQEALQWCETSFVSGSADSYLIGYFYDGKLLTTNTYRNRMRGTCESFFQPVQWISPDRIIELRAR
jgi:hypothetical protein